MSFRLCQKSDRKHQEKSVGLHVVIHTALHELRSRRLSLINYCDYPAARAPLMTAKDASFIGIYVIWATVASAAVPVIARGQRHGGAFAGRHDLSSQRPGLLAKSTLLLESMTAQLLIQRYVICVGRKSLADAGRHSACKALVLQIAASLICWTRRPAMK